MCMRLLALSTKLYVWTLVRAWPLICLAEINENNGY